MTPAEAIARIRELIEKATAPPPMVQDFREPFGPTMVQLAIRAQAEELHKAAPTELARLCDALEVADKRFKLIDASGTMSPMDADETILLMLKDAREARAEISRMLSGEGE